MFRCSNRTLVRRTPVRSRWRNYEHLFGSERNKIVTKKVPSRVAYLIAILYRLSYRWTREPVKGDPTWVTEWWSWNTIGTTPTLGRTPTPCGRQSNKRPNGASTVRRWRGLTTRTTTSKSDRPTLGTPLVPTGAGGFSVVGQGFSDFFWLGVAFSVEVWAYYLCHTNY